MVAYSQGVARQVCLNLYEDSDMQVIILPSCNEIIFSSTYFRIVKF